LRGGEAFVVTNNQPVSVCGGFLGFGGERLSAGEQALSTKFNSVTKRLRWLQQTHVSSSTKLAEPYESNIFVEWSNNLIVTLDPVGSSSGYAAW